MQERLRTATEMPPNSVHAWIIDHDEKWLFTILYIGLAVVLSVWLSLFWLLAVVAVHFSLEFVRQLHLRSGFLPVILEVFWELKLDIALVLFALALSLYLNVLLGVVGLRSAARLAAVTRAGLRSGSRIAGWERTLRAFFLSVDDLAQVFRAFTRRGISSEQELTTPPASAAVHRIAGTTGSALPRWGSWVAPWSKGDWLALALAAACVVLIWAAPWFTEHTYASILVTLRAELQPLPIRH